MEPEYTYRAKVIRVVDGDTIDAVVELGFHVSATLRFRILGVDAAERNAKTAEERASAQKAVEFVSERLLAKSVIVQTTKADSFGRWLASVFHANGNGVWVDIAAEMLAEGIAVPYRRKS